MNNRITEAFDEIRATDALKEKTMIFINGKRNGYQNRYHTNQLKLVLSVLIIMLLGGSVYTFFTPIAAVSVDTESSLELKINQFDKVIAVDEYNENGEIISSNMNIGFRNYKQVIDEILGKSLDGNDEIALITILCDDEHKKREIISQIEQCEQVRKNQGKVHCYSSNSKLAHEAHEHRMVTGKYHAYLELLENNPSVTREDIKKMSMREIYSLINYYHEGNGKHHGQGHHGE